MPAHFATTHAVFTGPDCAENARRAAAKIRQDFSGRTPACIVFYAATDYDPETLAAAMADAFPGAVTMGCTTAGEAVDAVMLSASVVAMAFDREAFDFCGAAAVVSGGETDGENVFPSADAAADFLERSMPVPLRDADYRQYVGFMLSDSISAFSESVLSRMGERTDVFFLGGFAGNDYKFGDGQRVFFNGRALRGAAVLALWKPSRGFAILKTQAAEVTEHSLVITRADEENRIIWEFNGEPAAPLYARLIGVPVEKLDVPDFDAHPLAHTADGDPYLQAVMRTEDGLGLRLFAPIRENTRVMLTNSGDVVASTRQALEKITAESGPFSAVLHVNCASRQTTLRQARQVESFAHLFESLPGIAFTSYGEIYVGVVTMTSTMVLFK